MSKIDKLFESVFGDGADPIVPHQIQTTPNDVSVPIEHMVETQVSTALLDIERILHIIGDGAELPKDIEAKLRAVSKEIATIADILDANDASKDMIAPTHYTFGEDDKD